MPYRKVTGITSILAMIFVANPVFAQSIADTCTKAAKEPPLMWYSSQDPAFNGNVIKAFREKYPDIQADSFRLPSGALAARYSSERDAGVINGDLISLSDANFVAAARTKSWIAPLKKDELPALAPLEDRLFDNGVALTGINVSGITFNTSMVGGTPPTKWKDLLRPEFKGKIALADPRNVPSFMGLFRILRDEFGDDFLTKLAAQDLVVVSSAVPGTQQVAAGEFAVVFPNTLAVTAPVKLKGGPVDFVVPGPTTGVEYTTMLSAGADSPNAAKCLYNFLFTEAGQRTFNGTTSIPALANLKDMPALPNTYKSPNVLEIGAHTQSILKLLNLK